MGVKFWRGAFVAAQPLWKTEEKFASPFFEEEEVEKIHARDQKKRALSIVHICLCDETIHSYERKTNGVKRERVLRFAARFERADIQMRSRVQNTVEKRSSLSCAFGCFFLSFVSLWWDFFFLNLPQKDEPTPKKEVWIKQKWRLARNTNFSRPPRLSEAASGRPPLLPRPRARLLFLRLRREEKEEEEEERRFPMPNHHHHRAKTPEEASGWKRNRTSQIYSTRQKSRRKRRFGGNSPRRTGFFSPRPRRTRPGRKRRNVYGWS